MCCMLHPPCALPVVLECFEYCVVFWGRGGRAREVAGGGREETHVDRTVTEQVVYGFSTSTKKKGRARGGVFECV